MKVRLDSTWRRPLDSPADGNVVIAGSPLRLFRLSVGGAHVIGLAEQGEVPDTPAIRQLIDRFLDAGALHPVPDVEAVLAGRGPFSPSDVTVVMPCHGAAPLGLTSTALAGMRAIVVDDASAAAVVVDASAPTRVHLIRRAVNGGPAAARNTGLAHVDTPLVAFVDADVRFPHATAAEWLAPLLAHFADDRVALVAPRIVGAPVDTLVGRYEQQHSPLDLGPEPARIAAGTRVSYVPAAVVLCRTAAVRGIGGFDETLRTGEDVDLVWRLAEAGHRCRYEPTVVADHEPRPHISAWLRQRVGYGRSAAPLAVRHPGALAPVRMSGWSAAAWALVAARRPVLAAAAVAGTTVALMRKLTDVPPADAARLAVRGHLAAGRQLARAMRRVWWPFAVVAALCSQRIRRLVLVAVVAEPVLDACRQRSVQPVRDAPLALADDLAYGVGVWAGVFAEREAGPLVPGLSAWPPRAAR